MSLRSAPWLQEMRLKVVGVFHFLLQKLNLNMQLIITLSLYRQLLEGQDQLTDTSTPRILENTLKCLILTDTELVID